MLTGAVQLTDIYDQYCYCIYCHRTQTDVICEYGFNFFLLPIWRNKVLLWANVENAYDVS